MILLNLKQMFVIHYVLISANNIFKKRSILNFSFLQANLKYNTLKELTK